MGRRQSEGSKASEEAIEIFQRTSKSDRSTVDKSKSHNSEENETDGVQNTKICQTSSKCSDIGPTNVADSLKLATELMKSA